MGSPTQQDITVDPELAVLHILDVAADMANALLVILHPPLHDPEAHHDRGHHIANRIIREILRLRRSLHDYQQDIDDDDRLDQSDFPF